MHYTSVKLQEIKYLCVRVRVPVFASLSNKELRHMVDSFLPFPLVYNSMVL